MKKSIEYYHANKEHYNYTRKINKNKQKYGFLKTVGDVEYWIKVRKHFMPFAKILKDVDDIEYMLEFCKRWLEFKKENNLITEDEN